ncbi:MAG: hypothetical protein KF716_13030 [Anaerolineae bacterium]|nr:hypothetical protein [Anaerolineae bacterium]
MSYLTHLLISLHALSLRLYPTQFRAEFGDELRDTFSCLLQDVAAGGVLTLCRLCWNELRQFPQSIAREYQHAFALRWRNASQRELTKIRWMTRGLSVFVLWFLLTVVQQGLRSADPQFMPFVLMSAITALCISVAWLNERLGGWLTIYTSVSMGVALFIIALSLQHSAYAHLFNYFVMYLLYIVPSFITGLLFMSVSKAGRRPRSLAS